jgi:para-aminobenzoate synthetase component 1
VASHLPLVEELSPVPDILAALRAVRHLPRPLLFESVLHRPHVGRYSFLTADPSLETTVPKVEFGTNPLQEIQTRLHQFNVPAVPGLPPFQGGLAGLLGYGAGHIWERLPQPQFDEFQIPDIAVGLYDWVLAWDHHEHRAWLISQGFPELSEPARSHRASERIRQIRDLLRTGESISAVARPSQVVARLGFPIMGRAVIDTPILSTSGTSPKHDRVGTQNFHLPIANLAPQYQISQSPPVFSTFSRDNYLASVQRAIDYIYAGDIFQVNLSQRLMSPLRDDPLELYARLRARNPAPFAGYFEHPDWVIASASPERFICAADGAVESRPIKGTRRRQSTPEADLFTQDALRESAKDHSENVMIVDLLRNDLSKVCQPGSMRVPELCAVETYETVQHLVSQVVGKLRPGVTGLDLLAATFPGGSITGAPKVRAMEIIAELEPTARGPYCGCLFYVGFDGRMDSSILIRTFTVSRGWIQFPVGGGIVAMSDAADEYEETLHKAAGMLRALQK